MEFRLKRQPEWWQCDEEDLYDMEHPEYTMRCEYCSDTKTTRNPDLDNELFICSNCQEYLKEVEQEKLTLKKEMENNTAKLIHFTDLDGKDRFYMLIDTGKEVRQQEINRHEYEQLKSAEISHYQNQITSLKEKYRLIDEERTGA